MLDDYLLLGLRIGRHIDGFVDAYYGPAELAEQAEREEPVAPDELAAEAGRLRALAETDYLRAQLAGLETTSRRLAGEALGWADEVEGCYGVRPEWTDESVFAAAHEQLDAALPGDGELGDRFRAWQDSRMLPADRVLAAAARFQEVLRERTVELFGLPEREEAEIELVRDEPWSGFNYYLGGRRSRVAVNTDLPVYSHRVPELVAHEIYPGHHTEHAWKEALLVDGGGRVEETIFLTGTPQAVISEGIATLAPEIVDADGAAAEVYASLGIEHDAVIAATVRDARRPLRFIGVNASHLLHVQGVSREEAVEYLARWYLIPREHAEKNLEFLVHPTWRAYVSSYTTGYDLCKRWVGGDTARFRRLLTEQLSTHDLLQA